MGIEHYPEIIGLEEVVDEGISVETEVEKIVSRKKFERKLHYEVMWKDGSITWEPARNLTNCRLLLRDFLQSVKAGGGVAGLKKLQETSSGQEWERRDAVEESMVQTESSQRQAGQEQSSIASSTRSYRSKQSKKSPSISPVVLIDHDPPPPVLINNYTPPPVLVNNQIIPPVLINDQIIPPVLIND